MSYTGPHDDSVPSFVLWIIVGSIAALLSIIAIVVVVIVCHHRSAKSKRLTATAVEAENQSVDTLSFLRYKFIFHSNDLCKLSLANIEIFDTTS